MEIQYRSSLGKTSAELLCLPESISEVRPTLTLVADSLPFVGPQATGAPSLAVPDLAAIDPSTYIEPMELYDSIFWGESTPSSLFILVPTSFLRADLRPLLSSQNHQTLGTLALTR